MKEKRNILPVVCYGLTGLCLLAAACCFGVKNQSYWVFLAAAFISLGYGIYSSEKRKTTPKQVLAVSLAVVLLSSFGAQLFATSGFRVSITSFTLTKAMTEQFNKEKVNGKSYVIENDCLSYGVDLYVPDQATKDTPAPVVFVMPGFTRTKETQAQYCIELARRGMVVFCMDPGSQGATTYAGYKTNKEGQVEKVSPTVQANGLNYLVQYVYNNKQEFDYIDRSRIGAMGHSAGGGNVVTTAAAFAGDSYEDSVIKALYISGYIKSSSADKYKELNCNTAMSYALYDEGEFRYTGEESYNAIALRFINEVGGNPQSNEEYELGREYGAIADGTYRVLYREPTNHCFEMYDKLSVANVIGFFDKSFEAEHKLSPNNHIWWGKEVCSGIALLAGMTAVIALAAILLNTGFFLSLKKEAPDRIRKQNRADKMIFWSSAIVTAIIACLDYIPLAYASMFLFADAAGNNYTCFFPARMVNAVVLWAVVNGIIGLGIYFGTAFIRNKLDKTTGEDRQDHFSQFRSLEISGRDFGKTFLLAILLFGAFYGMVQVVYLLFHQDFRFMLICASPLKWRFVVTWLIYIPFFFIFYLSNSIRVNCGMVFENWKEWQIMLVGGLANTVGLVGILVVNYFAFFKTGTVYYSYYGAAQKEVWLYVNMVFAIIPMMFALPVLNRIFYRMTNRVYLGPLVVCMTFIMMTLSASVSYIPL